MPASPKDVAAELEKLGLDPQLLEHGPGVPDGINVWDPEKPSRLPVTTAWEPREGTEDGWNWGPNHQFGAYPDDDAETVATKVVRDLETIARLNNSAP